MKKKRDLIQVFILFVLGAAVLFALALPDLPSSQPKRTTVEISLFLREADSSLTSNTRLGMEAAAVEYGAELRFVTPPTEESHLGQISLIRREIEGGANALIVAPIDPIALGEEKFTVPLLTMESEVEHALLCMAPDGEKLGAQLARALLADHLQGTILLLDTAGHRTGIQQRLTACTQILEAENCTVSTCTLEELPDRVSSEEIAAIVASDYQTTLSVANWETGQAIHHKLYGVGGTSDIAGYLERGILQATVTWSEYATGYLTIQRAVEAVTGQTVAPVPAHTITTIRGETIYDTDNQKLLFPVV